MSALWSNHYYAIVSPSKIVLAQIHGLPWMRKFEVLKSLELREAEQQTNHAKLILDGLATLLSHQNIKGGKLDILLSNHLTRIELLPALSQALKFEEQLKRAQLHFERIYGVLAKQWAFCFDSAKFNQATLASAIDQTLLLGLRNLAQLHDLKLCQVEPGLMYVLNYWQHRVGKSDAWLISLMQSSCTFAKFQHGNLIGISQITYKKALSVTEFETLLQREALQHGDTLKGKNLYLLASHHSVSASEVPSVKLQRLTLPTVNANTKFTDAQLIKLLVEA